MAGRKDSNKGSGSSDEASSLSEAQKLRVAGKRLSDAGEELGPDMYPAHGPPRSPLFLTPRTAKNLAPEAIEAYEIRQVRQFCL